MKKYLSHQDKIKNSAKINQVNDTEKNKFLNKIYPSSKVAPAQIEKMQTLISIAQQNDLAEIITLSNNAQIISKTASSNFKRNEVLSNEYGQLKSFTQAMASLTKPSSSKKMQTGKELIKEVIEFDKNIQYRYLPFRMQGSISNVIQSYEYFKDHMEKGNGALVFDLETLGGTKKSGARAFDGITEFGYTIMNKGMTFEESQNNMSKFLVGIDEKTYKKYTRMLEDGKFNYTDEYSSVVANRLALYGHEDTVIDKSKGAWKITKMGQYDKKYTPTEDEIKKGIEVLRQAHIADSNTVDTVTGLTQSQAARLEMLKIMKSTDIPIVGYNSSRSDVLWNELDFYNLPGNVQNIFKKELNFKPNQSFFQPSPRRQFDVFKLLKTAQQGSSVSNVYMGKTNLATGNSALSQETIAKTLFPQIMATQTAHGVGADVGILTQIANKEDLLENAYKVAKEIEETSAGKGIELNYGKQLFMASQSDIGGSPLDFLIEPNGQIRLKSGYTITKGGEIIGDHNNQRMFHKNSLYTIEGAGIVKTTEQTRKSIQAINTDYALDNLYYLDLKGYTNAGKVKTGNLDSMSTRRLFFNKQEDVETFMQNFLLIGERGSKRESFKPLDKDKYGEYIEKVSRQLEIIDITKPRNIEKQGFNEIVENATRSEMTERAEHAIRTNDYKKMKDMRTIATVIENDSTMKGVKKPKGLVVKMQKDDLYFSVRVSRGKSVKLKDVNYQRILNAIGFDDVGQKRVYNQTIDKIMGISEHYYNNNLIIDNVLNTVDKMNLKTAAQKQYAYSYLMDSVSSTLSKEYLETNPAAIPLKLARKDTHYIEFDKEIFDSRKNIKKYVSTEAQFLEQNLIRINTVGKDAHYNLMNSLLKAKYGEIPQREADRIAQSFSVLESFNKHMQSRSGFKKAFENIKSFEEYSSPEVMASDIIQAINSAKVNHPEAGIIKKTLMPSTNSISQEGNKIVKKLGGVNKLQSIINEATKTMPKNTVLTKENVNKLADEITSSMFDVSNLAKNKSLSYAKKQGLVGNQAKYWANLYEQSVYDYRTMITDMVKELTNIDGVTFEFDQKSKRMFVRHGKEALEITQQLPQLNVNGPLMSLKLGKMNLNLHGVITGNQGTFNANSVRFQTNIMKSYEEGKFSFKKVARVSNKNGNPLHEISLALTQFGNALRSVSNIDGENIQKQLSNNVMDVSYAYRAAVQLDIEGQLENIPGIKKDLVAAVRKFRGSKTIDELDFSNLSATYVENVHQNLQPIMNKITNDKKKTDEILAVATKVMTPQASEKYVSKGFMGTGVSNVPYADFAKGSRIVQFQNNFYRFFKSNSTVAAAKTFTGETLSRQQAASVLNDMGISVGSKINTPYTFNLENFKSVDQSVAYQITTNKVVVSDKNFSKIVQDHIYTKKSQASSSKGEINKIAQKLQNISLLEDETLVNPRLFDSFFTNQKHTIIDEDKISTLMRKGHKKRLKELSNTMYDIAKQEDGTFKIQYGKGVKKKTSEILFDIKGYKDSQEVKLASHDGTLKYGFIDKPNNIILSEDQINKKIAKAKDINEVNKILSSFKSSFYFERDYDERYRKIIVSNVEKSKASQIIFNVGEYDTKLKEELSEYIGAKNPLLNKDTSIKDIDEITKQIQKNLTGKKSAEEVQSITKDLEKRMLKERYAAWDFIQEAFGKKTGLNEAIGLFTNENIIKHEGVAQLINENISDLISIQHKEYGLSKKQATEKVISQLSGIIPGFAEGQYSINPDGSIITNTIPDIDSRFNIAKLRELKQSEEYKKFFGEGSLLGRKLVENDKGNVLAVITKTTLSETEEYNLPGANMPIEYVKTVQDFESDKQFKKSEIKKIRKEIREYEQTYDMLSTEEKVEIDNIIKTKKRKIENIQSNIDEINKDLSVYKKAYKEQFKGMSISEREFLALNNYKYDKDELGLLKSRLHNKFGSDELFEEYFSEVLDKNGNISNKIDGKLMFANYIKGIRKQGIEQTDHSELLSSNNYEEMIDRVFGNKDAHIKNGLKEAFETGQEKSAFQKISVESLEDIYFLNQSIRANNFNALNIKTEGSIEKMLENGFEKIHIDDMQFAMSDDIDVVEKLGKSVYSKNLLVDLGDGNLVASPYMPHSQFSGSVVQKDYQSDFKMIARSRQEMLEARNLGDSTAYEKAEKEYLKYKNGIVENIRNNTLGKEGVLKDRFKVRLDQSFRAKTSTAYERYEGFDKAMFNGKTIREWMDKGVYLDVSFGNEKMFENMGLFSKEHLNTLKKTDFTIGGEVVSKSGQDVTREMMLQKLETDGIDNITTRYPTNMEGSLTPSRLYLDKSISNSENKVKLAYWTQLAKNGDNDGDDLYGATMKYYDPKTNTYKNSMQTTAREGTDTAMMLRANTTNAYYAQMAKQKANAKTTIKDNFEEFIKKRTLEGEKVPEYFGNVLEDYTQEQLDDHMQTLREIEEKMGSKIDISDYSNVNRFLETVGDETQKSVYKKSLAFRDSVENQLIATVAKTRKKSIGEIDNLSYLLRREAAELAGNGNISQKELQSVNAIGFLATQNIISSKNAADIENPNIVDDFRDIINKAHYGEVDEERVTKFLDEQVKPGFKSGESVTFSTKYVNEIEENRLRLQQAGATEESIEKLQARFSKQLEETNYNEAKEDFMGFLKQLNNDEMRKLKQSTNIGTKISITENTVTKGANGLSANIISNKDFILDMASQIEGSQFSHVNPDMLSNAAKSVQSAGVDMDKIVAEMEEYALKRTTGAAALSKVSSKSMAGAAIGLAAAYMITGFIGGNPSTPATTQAHKTAKEENQEYTPQYALSDYGSDYKYESTNKGYVINIKSKGNDKDVQKAINTISQSISSSVNSNVNVNLKIQELSEIDNRKINKMVSDALNI